MSNQYNFLFLEYKEKYIPSSTKFLQHNFVIITRIFDDRVKSFIKHIFKNMDIANYKYRIEFQARGNNIMIFSCTLKIQRMAT